MKLRTYLDRNDMTPDQFARRIGVDAVSVRRYVKGDRRPRWDILARIAQETSGKVTADDFLTERCQAASEHVAA